MHRKSGLETRVDAGSVGLSGSTLRKESSYSDIAQVRQDDVSHKDGGKVIGV